MTQFDYDTHTWDVITSEFENRDALINHQLDSFNNLLDVLIPTIMRQGLPVTVFDTTGITPESVEKSTSLTDLTGARQYTMKLLKVGISKPIQYVNRQFRHMLPAEARLRNLSYSAPIFIDFEVSNGKETQIEEKVLIGKIPVMIGSKYCHLYGRSTAERVEMGECEQDRGGYFIVNGSEKVIIAQERPIENQIACFEEHDNSKHYVSRAEVKSTIDQRFFPIKITIIKLTQFLTKKVKCPGQQLLVFLPYAEKPIHLFIVFKALGILTDKDIMGYLTDGTDEQVVNILLPSAVEGNVVKTQEEAVKYISVHMKTAESNEELKIKYTQDILAREFLPHVGFNVQKKLRYLSLMVQKLIKCYLNPTLYTDRDKLSNKRVDLSGPLIATIYRYLYQRLIKDIKTHFVKEIKQNLPSEALSLALSVRRIIQKCVIENKIKSAIATGNWFTNRSQANSAAKKGIAQVLQRLSYLGTLSHLRRVMSPLERAGSKHEPPRRYHGTQVPKICPNETPEGAQVGIVKNLSLLTNVTIDTSNKPVLMCLKHLGMIDINDATSAQVHHNMKIMVNGDFVGVGQDDLKEGVLLYRNLRGLKLMERISKYTSIAYHTDFNTLLIFTDGGRYITPYYTVNEDNRLDIAGRMPLDPREIPNVLQIKKLTAALTDASGYPIAYNSGFQQKGFTDKDRSKLAVIEYLDTNEDETAMIAVTPTDLYNGQTLEKIAPGVYQGHLTGDLELPPDSPADITPLVKACLKVPVNPGDFKCILLDRKTRKIEVRIDRTDQSDHIWRNLNRFLGHSYVVYTHCMIHPAMINGVVASAIPFSHHNQSPRNNYQSSMGKQAIGNYVSNYDKRMDTIANILIYPQAPTVYCRTNRYTGADKMHSGFTSMHAIACVSGYNQEDSLVSNKDAAARGAYSVCFYRTYGSKLLQKLPNNESLGEKFAVPPQDNTIGRKVGSGSEDRYHAIRNRNTGKKPQLPAIGAIVEGNDIIIPKYRSIKKGKTEGQFYNDLSITIRPTEGGVVDLVLPSDEIPFSGEDEDGYQICKVRICEMREEEIGDKFASRSAQKGTAGMQYDSADMIFNQDGCAPDKIMNAQAIPSRMTIGQLKEAIYSKAGILRGKFYDATPFMQNTEDLHLAEMGYDECGDEIMYNGQTGEMLDCPIFFNPTYYQRLKHMVADKMHARTTGPIQSLTRQPAEGRARNGGLRIGEMERDCMIAHGTAAYLKEKLTDSADIFEVFISKQKQTIISANPKIGVFQHGTEDIYSTDDICKLHVPYALHLFRMELKTMLVDYNFLTD
jgi:DNA-directed RNA polymerase II subunit RPB2